MKTLNNQDQMSRERLYARGWTISQAARELNRSPQHVAEVLRGRRQSPALMEQLAGLPSRELITHRRESI